MQNVRRFGFKTQFYAEAGERNIKLNCASNLIILMLIIIFKHCEE